MSFLVIIIAYISKFVISVSDMNLGQLEYLSDHLNESECIQFVYKLMRYESLNDVPKVECISNLIHWDRTLGRGLSGEDLMVYLTEIGRNDLAEKLERFILEEKKFELENSPIFKGKQAEVQQSTDSSERVFVDGETIQEILGEIENEEKQTNKSNLFYFSIEMVLFDI